MTATPSRRPSPADLRSVIETLCLAFDTDPVTEWNFPRHLANRPSLVEGFFRLTTEMILDHGGYVAATPGYEAVGVWSPPDAAEPTEAELADYASALVRACGEGAERALTIMRAIDASRPADIPPAFHVLFIGVRPDQRKQGGAVEILAAVGQALIETGTGVYGEASNEHSRALWQRFGASQAGPEIQLPESGPSLYPMWAPPGHWHVGDLR